ncbi:hypothetical protein K1T71_011058 [Dendrolimus kikuchii]|uniref:Uncharacterized protein n=1 Tax=Dendrolimus kikuchii TaxID=765133 RepID=A0ACC1CN24_9NEOP|nr:hypothetical protein K1T71_011058 [Dendrolimus kikuchii]
MSNVGYDLDTSGGLMPLIRALIKPPDEDLSTQKPKKPQHPYYKRPGKGHNHDSCDACGEGGDLICCDRCPASFHLGCYDPPLDENDIPAGLWLCRECRGYDENKPASSKSSRAQSPVDNKSDCEKKTRSLRNSTKKTSRDGEEEIKMEIEKELSPMEILVKAAKIMNPKQFELPREMQIPCPFPGTDKEGSKNGNATLITVDSWGCVPIPAKLCYVCQGTCKQAPLLQCDYCPLLFHQDCLDPPLTALPTGRWMCPNHVEQYIDWKLVNSISATERVALWEKFSGPVDQHAIKLDFIRRARNPAPRFRIKVPVGVRGRVVVPDMVRYHYQNPPPLLPSRREHLRCRNVLKNLKAIGAYSESEDEDSAPKTVHKICMNTTCPSYSGSGECCHSRDTSQDGEGTIPVEALKAEHSTDSSSDMSDSDYEYLNASVKRRKVSQTEDKCLNKRGKSDRLELRPEGDVEELLAAVDNQLKKLDQRLVKLLAWQRLQQVLVGEQCNGLWKGTALSRAAEAAVVRSVDRTRLAKHGFKHVALPSELLSRTDRERIARAVWGGGGAGGGARGAGGASPPPSPGHSLSDACVRATLCQVHRPARNGLGDGLGRPIPMRLSSLSVGTDSGCDVRLDAALCRCVSRNHAVIFMDEVSRHFELINYSEWGTKVNGVVYACDVGGAGGLGAAGEAGGDPPPAEADAGADRQRPEADALRAIVRHRVAEPQRLNGNLTCPPAWGEAGCGCPPRGPRPTGGAWEGSALVPHGALLQFGCLMFVFSITDAQAFPYEKTDGEPAL